MSETALTALISIVLENRSSHHARPRAFDNVILGIRPLTKLFPSGRHLSLPAWAAVERRLLPDSARR